MIRNIWKVHTIALIAGLAFQRAGIATESEVSTEGWRYSPEWTKDLVIYEIATKAFTSPAGPESGTFEGVESRLQYLQDLGVTGIWLIE